MESPFCQQERGTNMDGLDTKRKRHITGGILLSVSFLFGGLAITVMTIKNEEDEYEQ